MSTLKDEDFIFIFNTKRTQMLFEFWYLVGLFFIGLIALILISLNVFNFDNDIRISAMSFIGGFFGGWVFVTKWFYRVTARGKDNQKKWEWESHKIYWRIFTPFISSIISITLYSITVSEIIPFISIDNNSFFAAFGFSFIMGYFADILMTKLFDWTTFMWGTKNENSDKYAT